ncbi:MAG: deoxyribonuclease IV [Planctomycetes bacterium]|nr:deoxyribonuclease IV [Planctomycetota bacterium]
MKPKLKSPTPPTQRFGSHVTTAGGLHNAFTEGLRVGCDCIQIFVKNQRQWVAKPITDEQIKLYKEAERAAALTPIVAHASYLINLASPDAGNREKSIAALSDELTRCEALGLHGLVVHPGAHLGEGDDAGIRRVCESLDEVHRRTAGFNCPVLLESTAGQGTTLGHKIEHLAAMIDVSRESDRLAICLDTCHLFVAGYDIRDAGAFASLADSIEQSIGLDRVKCIHMNDSKGELGSHLDRHEHIGSGKIGLAGLSNVLKEPRLAHASRILETEKGNDEYGNDYDVANLGRLRQLIA